MNPLPLTLWRPLAFHNQAGGGVMEIQRYWDLVTPGFEGLVRNEAWMPGPLLARTPMGASAVLSEV